MIALFLCALVTADNTVIWGQLDDAHVQAVSSGAYTGTGDDWYTVEITTGGPSGTAEATVTSSLGDNVAAAAVTSGATITVGTNGVLLTLTWIDWLPLGMKYGIQGWDTGNLVGPAQASGSNPLVATRVLVTDDLTGSLLVLPVSSTGPVPELTSETHIDTISGTTADTLVLTNSAHAFIFFNNSASDAILLSIDGTNYNITIRRYGTYSWIPPGNYVNAVPIDTLFIKGSAAGSFPYDVTAWGE